MLKSRFIVRCATLATAAWLCCGAGAHAQTSFANPTKAVEGLKLAVKSTDPNALLKLFGPEAKDILETSDPILLKEIQADLARLLDECWSLTANEDGTRMLRLGLEGWPFPVPLAKSKSEWYWDGEAGREEILARRVGRNELLNIETCRRLQDAQEDYRESDRDGDGVREYSNLLRSTEGKRDGLYWEVKGEDEELSPLEQALIESIEYAKEHKEGTPWYGYKYKLVTGQGPLAPGGAQSYEINGHLTGGYGVIAYPADYGMTGVTTFICSKDGIWERDLGPETSALVEAMKVIDPGQDWDPVDENNND